MGRLFTEESLARIRENGVNRNSVRFLSLTFHEPLTFKIEGLSLDEDLGFLQDLQRWHDFESISNEALLEKWE